ncbi:MAG: LysE family translocator [Planktomarina sp.]
MTVQGWIIFASFWAVFVVTPGPNAVNCITNGMTFGFRRGLWAVLAILTQASMFLVLSAFGITALILASPSAFFVVKMIGAVVLIYLGIKGWINAATPPKLSPKPGSIYGRALMIATINAKSVAGYLAAFSQFVQVDVPIWDQMIVIAPTALCLTALSYCGYTALGAGLGRAAMAKVFDVTVRRVLAICFIAYGLLLGSAAMPRGI